MKRRLIIIPILAFTVGLLSAQTLKQYEKAAKTAFEKQDYYGALYYLDIIQSIDSTKIDLQYKQAEAARHFNAYKLAEKRYKQVLESDEAKKFPLAIFWLASVQKMQGMYELAIANFQKYLEKNSGTNDPSIVETKAQIEACEWSKERVKTPDKGLKIIQLEEKVNSPYSEFGPTHSGDVLLFSSLKFEADNDKSFPPKLYSKILKTREGEYDTYELDLGIKDQKLHTAHTAFNATGDRLFFNICKYVDGNIIQCRLVYKDLISEDNWSETKELPAYINVKESTTTQPNVAYDESLGREVLFFVSDRLGGKGGLDIYYSPLDEQGLPEAPMNFEAVNTSKDDVTPFFHAKSQTLYYSTNGRQSLGGFDVYKTIKQDGKWSKIVHTGYPLSTSYNDIYFTLNDNGNEGYFASNREGSKFLAAEITACCNDIFRAEFEDFLLDLLAFTFNAETKADLLNTEVALFEMMNGVPKEITFKKLPNGNQHFYQVRSNRSYMLIAKKENFFPDTIYFNTNDATPGEALRKDLYLQPLKLNVLTFESNLNTPLEGVIVSLIEVDENGTEKPIDLITPPIGNSYYFPLKANKNYRIVAEKEGFEPTRLEFNTLPWSGGPVLTKNIILEPIIETIVLPTFEAFPLYFDNDQPNPNTLDTLTEMTFPLTLAEYKSQKDRFKRGYSSGLNGEAKWLAEQKIEDFFEKEMDTTYLKFIEFTDAILDRLQFGRNVTISVMAYTSPLASSEYNLNLSKRRISSMINFYRTYKNGAMRTYVDSGKLRIELVSYGETKAPRTVSDSPVDRRNSVFSVEASKERRVEILEVRAKKDENPDPNEKLISSGGG